MHIVRYTDKSGRGATSTLKLENMRSLTKFEDPDMINWDGQTFYEWIHDVDRTDGDIWENASSRYEIIKT